MKLLQFSCVHLVLGICGDNSVSVPRRTRSGRVMFANKWSLIRYFCRRRLHKKSALSRYFWLRQSFTKRAPWGCTVHVQPQADSTLDCSAQQGRKAKAISRALPAPRAEPSALLLHLTARNSASVLVPALRGLKGKRSCGCIDCRVRSLD